LLRLKASLGTQLLNPKERLKVLLPCGKPSLLVGKCGLKSGLCAKLLHTKLSREVLLCRLLRCLLISKSRLKSGLCAKLLHTQLSSKILLAGGESCLLVSHRCLHLSRTVSAKLLRRLLECLLPTSSLNALQLTLKVPVCLRL